ncbi:MAG: sigma-70 family RNA polymerase sigma factor [bacterium]|nr:sigma-70 family RNA polymerase sigma factor [bacterium]
MHKKDDITQLLDQVAAGDDRAVDVLLPMLYEELRAIAEYHLKAERPDHTLQATALVHEAYLRMVNQDRVVWESRAHFLAIASQAIRRILVDAARARNALKRGGDRKRLLLDTGMLANENEHTDLVALDDALAKLHERYPDKARIVELRFFGGLTGAEVSTVLDIPSRTVDRHWQFARAWLFRELGDHPEDAA